MFEIYLERDNTFQCHAHWCAMARKNFFQCVREIMAGCSSHKPPDSYRSLARTKPGLTSAMTIDLIHTGPEPKTKFNTTDVKYKLKC